VKHTQPNVQRGIIKLRIKKSWIWRSAI